MRPESQAVLGAADALHVVFGIAGSKQSGARGGEIESRRPYVLESRGCVLFDWSCRDGG